MHGSMLNLSFCGLGGDFCVGGWHLQLGFCSVLVSL